MVALGLAEFALVASSSGALDLVVSSLLQGWSHGFGQVGFTAVWGLASLGLSLLCSLLDLVMLSVVSSGPCHVGFGGNRFRQHLV